MTSFLSSVKADLLDRRLLPLVVVVGLALLGAVAYTVLDGGSSATTPPASVSSRPVAPSSGVAVSQVSPETAVAETTSGTASQRRGVAHNPFVRLPEPAAATSTTTTAAPSSSASSSSSSSGSSSSAASEPAPATPAKPAAPAKPKTVYHVAVLFGPLPAEGSGQTAQLTPYENLKLLTPLPSAKQALVVFRGVRAGGKSATFTLVGEAILHGKAACLPSASRCEAIDLQPGQSEQLEYLSSTGQPVTDELTIVSITSSNASSAGVKNVQRGESKAGRDVLGRAGLVALPEMRYSSQAGVLVFAGHSASAAHSARRSHHSR